MSTQRLHELLGGPAMTGSLAAPLPGAGVARRAVEPPPGRETTESLLEQFNKDPEGVTAAFQDAIERDIDPAEVKAILERLDGMVENPSAGVAELESIRSLGAAKPQLPADWVEQNIPAKYRDPSIEIDPYDYKFEDDSAGGILGWALYNLPKAIVPKKREPFRWHDDPLWGNDRFTYKIANPAPGKPLSVALFSDYANGLAHARYIARQLEVDEHPYAIHLGDIYYTGDYKECTQFYQAPLVELLKKKKTELFQLADNHEKYSGFDGFFWLLDHHHALGPHRQRGSYFCLTNDKFQFLAPDTIYHRRGRIDPRVLEWLKKRLRAGREQGKVNILLTSYHPYDHGKKSRTRMLRKDLMPLLSDKDHGIDLWFWGNVHYAALWKRSDETPFVGSCIGHAGYPYATKTPNDKQATEQAWLEEAPRYRGTTIREDRGNNGYCVLELHDDYSVKLRYVDWTGHEVASFHLERKHGVLEDPS